MQEIRPMPFFQENVGRSCRFCHFFFKEVTDDERQETETRHSEEFDDYVFHVTLIMIR